jgi:hypothetical protein
MCKSVNSLTCSVEQNKGWLSLNQLKCYFDVTNTYVLHKLRIIMLPFTVKGEDAWRPREVDIATGQGYENEEDRDL